MKRTIKPSKKQQQPVVEATKKKPQPEPTEGGNVTPNPYYAGAGAGDVTANPYYAGAGDGGVEQ